MYYTLNIDAAGLNVTEKEKVRNHNGFFLQQMLTSNIKNSAQIAVPIVFLRNFHASNKSYKNIADINISEY